MEYRNNNSDRDDYRLEHCFSDRLLGTLWKEASAGQRNRPLRSVFDAIYVDLGSREIVGLHPKESFMALVLAMEERSGVTITAKPDAENVRDGGDGEKARRCFRGIP